MSPQAWTELGVLLWALAATVVLGIQLFAWPDDAQKWSATITVFTTGVVLWRLWLAYRFGWTLGGTDQGILVFFTAALSWVWLAFMSWGMNRGRYGKRWQEWRNRWRGWRDRYGERWRRQQDRWRGHK